MKCEYCGNNSGKTDNRGCCISCGANLPKNDFIWLTDDLYVNPATEMITWTTATISSTVWNWHV